MTQWHPATRDDRSFTCNARDVHSPSCPNMAALNHCFLFRVFPDGQISLHAHSVALFLGSYSCSVAHLCPTLCKSKDCSRGLLLMEFSLQRILEWVAISFSRDLPGPGIKPTSPVAPASAGGVFAAEPLGKPRSCAHRHFILVPFKYCFLSL